MDDHHPDPSSEAAARVAQIAAMSISVAEALARLRAQRSSDRAAADQQAAAAARAHAHAAVAAARLAYAPALDNAWLRAAPTSALLDAWVATQQYPGAGPAAATAQDRVEQRLRQLHAEAMHVYDTDRADGYPPPACMARASGLFRGEFGLDQVGTPIHRSLADLDQHLAAVADATPDLLATPITDERLQATADAARHRAAAQAVSGLDVTWRAFPLTAEQAMTTAPKAAAKAMRALPAAPQRPALPASRSRPHP